MKNEVFRDYARIQKELELLETKRDKLKADITATMMNENCVRIKNRYGLFSLVKRSNYIYSPVIQEYELSVKHLKDLARKTGEAAIESTTIFLRHQD